MRLKKLTKKFKSSQRRLRVALLRKKKWKSKSAKLRLNSKNILMRKIKSEKT